MVVLESWGHMCQAQHWVMSLAGFSTSWPGEVSWCETVHVAAAVNAAIVTIVSGSVCSSGLMMAVLSAYLWKLLSWTFLKVVGTVSSTKLIYIYTYIYIYIYVFCLYIYPWKVYLFVYSNNIIVIYVFMYVCMYVCVYVCMYVSMHACM